MAIAVKLNERLFQLVKEHLGENSAPSWQPIADALNAEGLLNSRGGRWTRHSIRNYYNRGAKSLHRPTEPLEPEDVQYSPTSAPESGATGIVSESPICAQVPEAEADYVPTISDESSPTEAQPEITPTNIDEVRVRAIVREELNEMLQGIEPTSVQKSGRGGASATIKKSFSLPTDLWARVESLGGIASNHVAAALRVYLRLLDEKAYPGPEKEK